MENIPKVPLEGTLFIIVVNGLPVTFIAKRTQL